MSKLGRNPFEKKKPVKNTSADFSGEVESTETRSAHTQSARLNQVISTVAAEGFVFGLKAILLTREIFKK